jgi:hypothetical protein
MVKIGLKRCSSCDDREVHHSRQEPLTGLDQVCGFFLFQLVRCHDGEIRPYSGVFFPAPEYPYPFGLLTVFCRF